MVLRSEQDKMQALIRDAITLLCKSNLPFKKSISLEALVGITLDESDIILVSVKESIKHPSTPKKTQPMQIALKSVQTAVQRVNAKTTGKKSPKKNQSPKDLKLQGPSVINIMPTNLPDAQEMPVAIGTIETDSASDQEISFEFLNTNPKEEVAVKEEKDDDVGYGATTEGLLVPGPIIEVKMYRRTQFKSYNKLTSKDMQNFRDKHEGKPRACSQ